MQQMNIMHTTVNEYHPFNILPVCQCVDVFVKRYWVVLYATSCTSWECMLIDVHGEWVDMVCLACNGKLWSPWAVLGLYGMYGISDYTRQTLTSIITSNRDRRL